MRSGKKKKRRKTNEDIAAATTQTSSCQRVAGLTKAGSSTRKGEGEGSVGVYAHRLAAKRKRGRLTFQPFAQRHYSSEGKEKRETRVCACDAGKKKD